MAVTIEELEIIVKANVEQAMREVEKFKPYMEKAFASLAPAIERQGKAINEAFSAITPEVQNTAKQTKQAVESMQKDYESLAKAKKKEAEESKKASRLTEEEMKNHAELAKQASDNYNARFKGQNPAGDTEYKAADRTYTSYSFADSVNDLKRAMEAVNPEIESMSSLFSRLDGSADSALTNINNKIETQAQMLQKLKEQYESVAKKKGSESIAALGLQDKINAKEANINRLIAQSDKLAQSLNESETPMQKINKAAESAKEPIRQMARYAQAAKAPLQQMGAAIEQSAKKTNNFRSVFKKLEQQAKASTTKVKNMFGDLGRAIKQAITIGVLYKGFGKLFSFISNGIQDAIDAPEIQNMFAVALGNMAGQAEQFAQRLKESLGLDEYATKNMLGTFQNMITSMGIGDKTALNMSESLTLLANDMASLYNVPVDQAFENLQSALTGQGEAVKKYGYIVNEATKQEAALRFGLIKEGQTLTEAQKPLAAYLVLLSQSGNAQGDMSRTITSLQNQIRIFQQNMQAAGRSIGSAFEPIIQSVIPWLNGLAIVLQRVGTQLARFTYSLFGMDYDAEMKKREQSIADAAASAGKAQNTFGNAVDKTAKQVKGALASFDELHVIQKSTADSLTETSAGGYEVPDIPTLEMPEGENPFSKFADQIQAAIHKFTKYLEKSGLLKLIRAIIAAIKSAIEFVLSLAQAFWSLVEPILSALNIFEILYQVVLTITKVFETLKQIIDALRPAITLLANAFAPIAKWVGEKLVNAFMAWQAELDKWGKWFEDNKENFEELARLLGELVQKVWAVIEPLMNEAWNAFKEIVTSINEAVRSVAEKFVEFTKKAYEAANAVWDFLESLGVIQTISDFIKNAIDGIGETVKLVVSIISDLLGGIIDALGGLMDFITGVFTGDWDKAWSGIKTIFSSVWNSMKSIVSNIWNFIKDTAINIANKVKDTITGAFNGLVNFFKELPGKVGNALGSVFGKITQFGKDALNWLKNDFPKFINGIVDWFKKIPGEVKKVLNQVIEFFNKLPDKAIDFGKNFLKGLVNGILGIGNWFKEQIGSFWDGIKNGFSNSTQGSITPVPKLATGAVLRQSSLVNVAEYAGARTNPEIISPQSIMLETFESAIYPMIDALFEVSRNITNAIDNKNMIVNIGGETIAKEVWDPLRRIARQKGNEMVNLLR